VNYTAAFLTVAAGLAHATHPDYAPDHPDVGM
jgi:hypothetical protein